MKDKENLIKRDFLVIILHHKGGKVLVNCVEDNIVGGEEDHI